MADQENTALPQLVVGQASQCQPSADSVNGFGGQAAPGPAGPISYQAPARYRRPCQNSQTHHRNLHRILCSGSPTELCSYMSVERVVMIRRMPMKYSRHQSHQHDGPDHERPGQQPLARPSRTAGPARPAPRPPRPPPAPGTRPSGRPPARPSPAPGTTGYKDTRGSC